MRLVKAILCSAFLLWIGCLSGCDRPRPIGSEWERIDPSGDPEQHLVRSGEPIIITLKQGIFTLRPRATYRLSGTVVGTESYSKGWNSVLSPVDFAIAWGRLADPHVEQHISFSQSDRWYYYKAHSDSPVDCAYIGAHSGNHHIIPASQNVGRAVKSVRRKDKIVLQGVLVDVRGTYKGSLVMWNTSLSRTDTGAGSCELFYVTKARIESKVYE